MRHHPSRELGLVLAHQLIGADDLHFGLWDEDLELSLTNLFVAQQRYNELLLAHLPPAGGEVRLLDVGCGVGRMLELLVERGYVADGVVPSSELATVARQRFAGRKGNPPTIFTCRFEDFPADSTKPYDVAMFSESFQYVPLVACLTMMQRILKPGGLLLICDFFKSDAHGDGGPGDHSFGGGHQIGRFRAAIADTPFQLEKDEDLTCRMSPNIELINRFITDRAKPAADTLARFLEQEYPMANWVIRRLFRRKLDRLSYKYLAGHRTPEVFERYKTYRLLLYRLCGERGPSRAAMA